MQVTTDPRQPDQHQPQLKNIDEIIENNRDLADLIEATLPMHQYYLGLLILTLYAL
ncbi:MAG: hypothetical protein N0C88_10740 [Candidatus Thiodiazotropha lotti]|uniref:Uncharacterized protein n=1 Tax=Candidatus Thiodiazotropha lotti TaxID=2792787 RepID=A0A9E4K569_9GAMM|nr:hypothetical protein [Candidatus Thiodiazotropha lotti]MCW4203783.1 hypothetical protein [Candidatus Thiodiazotropha lotti]